VSNQVGKRYFCERCGSEMLVTRAGEGLLTCCGEPMQLRGAPASAPQAREASDG
jgi:desulfoferrodoxin-like iron-binding protein